MAEYRHTHTHTHKIDESGTSVIVLKSALSTYSEVLRALRMPLELRPPRHNKSVLWCCGAWHVIEVFDLMLKHNLASGY